MSWGRLKKYRMRTSKAPTTAGIRGATPDSSAAIRDALLIRSAGLAAKRLQGEVEPALAVGTCALEPGVPRALGDLARLLDLVLGRIHDGHAQLGQPLARAHLGRLGVRPLLLLEVDLLDGVEHRLLEILGEGVPLLLVRHQPLL